MARVEHLWQNLMVHFERVTLRVLQDDVAAALYPEGAGARPHGGHRARGRRRAHPDPRGPRRPGPPRLPGGAEEQRAGAAARSEPYGATGDPGRLRRGARRGAGRARAVVQITVRDLELATSFYDKLMPLLGFDPARRSRAVVERREFRVVEYAHARLCFAITSPRSAFAKDAVHRRRPGALHHLAFKAGSRDEVDRLHQHLIAIGAKIVSPPREYPEYEPAGYYALYFKDLEGIKYEIVTYGSQDHA